MPAMGPGGIQGTPCKAGHSLRMPKAYTSPCREAGAPAKLSGAMWVTVPAPSGWDWLSGPGERSLDGWNTRLSPKSDTLAVKPRPSACQVRRLQHGRM